MREETGYQRSLRREDLADAAEADRIAEVRAVAFASGRLLFSAHARGPATDGAPRRAALSTIVTAGDAALGAETHAFVIDALATLGADHETFVALLDEHGARLGWQAP
ncbi:MAG: hypothetical protein FJ137_14705 [Deltaproteobacteria bacterium]|nr:hypothetical protein [Deltaproteobacteria bacterium]